MKHKVLSRKRYNSEKSGAVRNFVELCIVFLVAERATETKRATSPSAVSKNTPETDLHKDPNDYPHHKKSYGETCHASI